MLIRSGNTPGDWIALSAMLPEGLVLAIADPDQPLETYPEEETLIERAVPKRQREFRLGRACARAALAAFGAPAQPLLATPHRGPSWPSGFTGSITHCEGFIGAVVGRVRDHASVGLDAELATPLDSALVESICTPTERRWPGDIELPVDPAKLFFSAKESVHKCVAPLTGTMLEFTDVTIRVTAPGRFVASLEPGAPDIASVSLLHGHFAVDHGVVVTLSVLPP